MLNVSHPKGLRLGAYLEALGHDFLGKLGLKNSELSLSLVTDRTIQALNRKWRAKNLPTDVLSFPSGGLPWGAPGPTPLGDVVISLDTARRQAKALGVPLEAELSRYLAHGLLHLLGHDHERASDARRMSAAEDALLNAPGMVRLAGTC